MNLVPLLLIVILILSIYSIVITYFYFRKREKRRTTSIDEDLNYKLEKIRYRMKRVRRETPSYIKLDIKNKSK